MWEAWGRNPHAPFGFAAARGRMRGAATNAMRDIAEARQRRRRPRAAANATHPMTRTGS